MSPRQKVVFDSVLKLYNSSSRPRAHWLWRNHVRWVADKSIELAKKYGADADLVYAGALLHDIADVWLDRKDQDFDQKCDQVAEEILQTAGYTGKEIDFVITEVIAPHSCHDDQPQPSTKEGQILATADGLAHLTTDFYQQFEKMGLPTPNKQAFMQWGRGKIERDFHKKIFFTAEKQLATANYDKLKLYFTQT